MPASFTSNNSPSFSVPAPLVALCKVYRDAGHKAWLVGGCVRDLLLERPIHDWDLATDALPDQTKRLFRRVVPTGIEHGTVTVLFQGQGYEVTTLRGEGAYSDGRRPDTVTFVRSLEEDLARRDFTVNAIAYDPIDEVITDPFGGQLDLQRRVLRAVGDPLQRFDEDGLRPLRGARFCATLAMELEAETEAAIRPTLDVFRRVSKERVREEWMKALLGAQPSRAFLVMERTGLLDACCPILSSAAQRPWPGSADCTVFQVLLCALDEAKVVQLSVPSLLAALFHQACGEGARDTKPLDDWFRAYRFSNAERQQINRLIHHAVPLLDAPFLTQQPGDAHALVAARRWASTVSREHAASVLALANVIAKSYQAMGVETPGGVRAVTCAERLASFSVNVTSVLASGCPLSANELALDGKQLMDALSMPPGPKVGQLRAQLLERVLDDPSVNTPKCLVTLAKDCLP